MMMKTPRQVPSTPGVLPTGIPKPIKSAMVLMPIIERLPPIAERGIAVTLSEQAKPMAPNISEKTNAIKNIEIFINFFHFVSIRSYYSIIFIYYIIQIFV